VALAFVDGQREILEQRRGAKLARHAFTSQQHPHVNSSEARRPAAAADMV